MDLHTAKQPHRIQSLFMRIASRYDLMNRLMTFGQDQRWRREVIRRAAPAPGAHFLDLGTGTGDLACTALQQSPAARVTAVDFTFEMLRLARRRDTRANWLAADASKLPFPPETFAAVTSGFLTRNVPDLTAALREQRRVLRAGGRIVILETTRPQPGIFTPLIWFHLHVLIPLLASMVAQASKDYQYLCASTENFLPAETLAIQMQESGFCEVGFRRLMFGTIAIHWGVK